ncbi:MAG: response regulator [Lachnospiraceae bacterium]|nr:response regulator [Lachnospiraceae bacterium]
MHDILLAIQYITISVLFIEMCIVFLRWKSAVHSYLFLACVVSFISNVGYLFEMKAVSVEAYITALKLSYTGRVWIIFAFFLFAAKICRKKIPGWLVTALSAVIVGVYASVLMIGSNDLYYPSYEFISDPVFPRFYHENGIVHDLFMGMNGVLSLIALYWLISMYRREIDKKSKLRMLMLVASFGVQVFAFILQITGLFGISEYYDLTMPGILLGTVFMLIAIFGFDLLGTREIARDFVIDRISEGIIAVDNEGRIQYYNEPVLKLFPEFDAFFSGKALRLHSNRKEGSGKVRTPYDIISMIEDAVKTDSTITIDSCIYTPEENDLIYNGERYGKIYALVDDTEHYEYMEELQKQRDIADKANETKSRFLANMSHEIRTPINAVLGMDEMILRESSEKSIRSYAADIMSAGRTLLSLINDILDLSKVEEGKMEIIPVQYDLSSLINDMQNIVRDRAEKKGLKLVLNVDPHIPHILFGDEIRIRQCAVNLLTNAVKYTEKGEVSLTVSHEKKDDAHISLTVRVEDTGIGMKKEDMENLFSPYKRIEEKRNRTIEGTGLGMSITKQLLSLMGSDLSVDSEYGKGSVFSFTIDQDVVDWDEIGSAAVKVNDRREASYEYRELFHAPDARILVVDDTEMNLTVIESLLKKTLIRIDTAMSGAEAVKLAEESSYDIIFIDHMMPDMDGIDTLKAIREGGASKDAPAVALTANAVSGAREMYLDAGFSDYLSKPVDGAKLERMIFNMLPADKISDDVSPDEIPMTGNAPASGESATTADASDSLPAELEVIKEIDAKTGISNCGSLDSYFSVLSVFHRTAAMKADEIESLYNDNDIENYTIKVHALKSSARIIGASELSKMAESLENAGKVKDTDFIDAHTEELLVRYFSLDAKVCWLDDSDDDLPEIDEKSLREAYQTIMEIADSMDYELMEDIIRNIKAYRLPRPDRERVDLIEDKLTALDWEGIKMTAGEAL